MQVLVLLYSAYLDSMPSKFFMFQTFLVLMVLQAAMWHLWIDVGSGNANFYFATSLLYAAWQVWLADPLHLAGNGDARLARLRLLIATL